MVEGEKLDAMAEKIAQIVTGVVLPELGDTAAQPADIAKGKVLYDDKGNPVTGTHECETGITLPELGAAAAEPGDILQGKRLYDDDGNLIIGVLPEVRYSNHILPSNSGFEVNGKSGDDTFHISGIFAESNIGDNNYPGVVARPGCTLWLDTVPTSLFGDATANQVAKGATFTSAAGLLVEGTVRTAEAEGDILNFLPSKVTVVKWDGDDSGFYCVVEGADTDTLLRAGSNFSFDIGEDAFGDATKEDVVYGKTFTSSTGVKVRGTKVINTETWTLTLEDGSTVEKVVHVE